MYREPEKLDHAIRRFHRGEAGMMAWGTIFAVLSLMILLAFVVNTINTVNRKIETQHAADAVAYSSSVWLARGMNSVTATNHIIGELNAMFVLHHALGARYLDNHAGDKKPNDTKELVTLNDQINVTVRFSWGIRIFGKKYGIDKEFNFLDYIKPYLNPEPEDEHIKRISENPVADRNSMLYEAKAQLKRNYRNAIRAHIIGRIIEFGKGIPVVGPVLLAAGRLIQGLAYLAEWKTYIEYLTLDVVESIAMTTSPAKKVIPLIISAIYVYQQGEVIARTPLQSFFSADKVAKHNHPRYKGMVRGDVPSKFPSSFKEFGEEVTKFFPKLPVEKEDTKHEERSQMLRATYPYVSHWRRPLIKAFDVQRFELKLPWPIPKNLRRIKFHSSAREFYRKWTNIYARQSSEWLRYEKPDSKRGNKYFGMLTVENLERNGRSTEDKNKQGEDGKEIRLYVMLDLNDEKNSRGTVTKEIHKSQEKWAQSSFWASSRADQIFCLIGFAKCDKQAVAAEAFFRQENPNGMLCYSQAMIYNANHQQPPGGWAGRGGRQAEVGWDTLNWLGANSRVPNESIPEEWRVTTQDFDITGRPPNTNGWQTGGRSHDMHKAPNVRLNWQAKLTPLTDEKMLKIFASQALFEVATKDEEMEAILLNNREAQIFLQNH